MTRARTRLIAALAVVSAVAPWSAQACVVGTGTGTCTEAALDHCLPGGGGGFDHTVTFDCGDAPETIAVGGTKMILDDTAIDGGGLITISGGPSMMVFAVAPTVTLKVANLAFTDGFPAIGNSGTVLVTNSRFTDNGGAIYNDHLAKMVVDSSTFSANDTHFGAIWNLSQGIATITNSTFNENSNSSGAGGAIDNWSGTLTVANCTFTRNSARGGGGIYNSGTATIVNSTFVGNSALDGNLGGGIYNSVENSGVMTVSNSILADNTGGNCSGTITDGGHNLDDGTTCGFSSSNSDPQLDSAGLQDNGGPTQTIALLPGSPAIDAGDAVMCASWPVSGVDQRAYVRPGPGSTRCSIGAFEYYPTNLPPDCGAALASPDTLGPPNHQLVSVSVTGVTDPDGDPVTIRIAGIRQDEPLTGQGSGDLCPDGFGVGTATAMLRAERAGIGDGRVYRVYFSADDGKGGSCSGVVAVCVPHDQGKGNACTEQTPIVNSTGSCS